MFTVSSRPTCDRATRQVQLAGEPDAKLTALPENIGCSIAPKPLRPAEKEFLTCSALTEKPTSEIASSMAWVSVGDQSSRLAERRSMTRPNHMALDRSQAARAARHAWRVSCSDASDGESQKTAALLSSSAEVSASSP